MGFTEAVERLLQDEGGYVFDTQDPGGKTKYGISQRTYPELDIEALSREHAIDIYRRDWWEKYGYDRLTSSPLAEKMLNLAVNVGPHPAHRLLQLALRDLGLDIAVDGVLGPQTIRQANNYQKPEVLLLLVKAGAVAHYRSLTRPRFLAGWVRRAMACVWLALALSGCAGPFCSNRLCAEAAQDFYRTLSPCVRDWYQFGASYENAVRWCGPSK